MAFTCLDASATGLSALTTNLNVIANNLANANTDGFKASRVNFQDLMYLEQRQPGLENISGDLNPTGLYTGVGTRVSGTQLDLREGPLVSTDQPLDVAISGSGFFVSRRIFAQALNALIQYRRVLSPRSCNNRDYSNYSTQMLISFLTVSLGCVTTELYNASF